MAKICNHLAQLSELHVVFYHLICFSIYHVTPTEADVKHLACLYPCNAIAMCKKLLEKTERKCYVRHQTFLQSTGFSSASHVHVYVIMVVVTVALPVYNAEPFLEECFTSILYQSRVLSGAPSIGDKSSEEEERGEFEIEVSIYEDSSTDKSAEIIAKWEKIFRKKEGFDVRVLKNEAGMPQGVGYGRNATIRNSTGEFICFCDADDIMEPGRIATQLKLCMGNRNALVGSKFRRIPDNSTKNFTHWANSLSQDQLKTQIYLSFGPSIVMPTWFCHRSVYDRVEGGFDEKGSGVPEDLIFFYKHLNLGGDVIRADDQLVVYRYHPDATTFSITNETIWHTRLDRFENTVLPHWRQFSIWNAGKLGRRFYRCLNKSNQNKIQFFCDVDKKKISQKWYHPYPIKTKIPIVHVKDCQPPFVICVKTELTWDNNGDFRRLLDSLNLIEGLDYFYFN